MAIDITAWYEKYGPMVIRRCRSLLRNDEEAVDAVQDVFVNVLKAGTRLKDTFPSSLLYTMATNVCLNRIRSRKREISPAKGLEDFFAAGIEALSFQDEGYGQVDAELLAKTVLEDESEETRTICFMYHADGMTYKEIASTLGISISGVCKKLEAFRKRARLKLGA